ncbi:MAG: hypothetical protein Ta2D_11830 [Rickettsiales bacterium]|nr:MAG: hypothetical protein Ta2D_11830 [Rickettsiales bacterium]
MLEKINNFIKNNTYLIIILLLCYSYYNNNDIVGENPLPGFSSPAVSRAKMIATEYNQVGQMVIQNFHLQLEVKNLEETEKKATEKIKEFNGEIINFSSTNSFLSYSIRIPTELLNQFLPNIKKLGNVKTENNTAYDVEENEKNDEIELQKLTEREKRLKEMFKKKESIEIYNELTDIEDRISAIKKNSENRNRNVNFTKITLTFTPIMYSNWTYNNSWNNAIKNAIVFKEKSINLFFNLVIFSPLILILYFAGKKIKK